MKKSILLFVLLSSSLLVFCSKESPTPDPPVKTTPEPSTTVPTDNSTTTTSTTSSSTSETDPPEETTTHVLDATGDLNDANEESVKNLLFGKWEFSSNAAKKNCSISFLEFTQDAYIIQLNQGENLITLTGQYSYTETEGKQIHLKNGFAPMATTIATIDGFRVEELNGELIAELNFSHFEIPAHIEGCSSPQGNYSAEKAEPVEHANFTEGAIHSRLIKSWQLNAYNSTQVESLYEFYNEFFCNYSEDESCPESIKIIVTFTTYGSYITTVQYGENPPANGGGRWEWVNEEQTSLRVYPIEDETGEAYARFDIITLDENDFVFEEYPLEEPDFKATWSFVAIQGQSIEIDLMIPDDVSTEEEEGDTSNTNTSTNEINAFFETRVPVNPISVYAEKKYLDTVTVQFINSSSGDIEKLEWDFGTQGSKTIPNSAISQPVEFTFQLQNLYNINSFKVGLTAFDKDGNTSYHEKELDFPIIRTEGYIKIGNEQFDIKPYECTLCNYFSLISNGDDEYTSFEFTHYLDTETNANVNGTLNIHGDLPDLNNNLESTSSIIPEPSNYPDGTRFYVSFNGYKSIDAGPNNSGGVIKKDSNHPKVYSLVSLKFKMKKTSDDTIHDAELVLNNNIHKSVLSLF